MDALKRKKRSENKNIQFKLARNLSMIFISFALMALLNLIKILSDKIFPILGGLKEAEAYAECDLMKIEERWDHKDSFQDCELLYFRPTFRCRIFIQYNFYKLIIHVTFIVICRTVGSRRYYE